MHGPKVQKELRKLKNHREYRYAVVITLAAIIRNCNVVFAGITQTKFFKFGFSGLITLFLTFIGFTSAFLLMTAAFPSRCL